MHESLTRMRMSDDTSSHDVRELREAIMKKDEVITRMQADLDHYQRQSREQVSAWQEPWQCSASEADHFLFIRMHRESLHPKFFFFLMEHQIVSVLCMSLSISVMIS